MARPATPPNPENAFPGLTLLELLERSAGHESAHARQIELTRKYNAAFQSRERALNIAILPAADPPADIPANIKDLLNMADYIVGDADALTAAAPYARRRAANDDRCQPRRAGQPRCPRNPRGAVGGSLPAG